MPSFEVQGLDDYRDVLKTLSSHQLEEIIGTSIYHGAGLVADKIRTEINNIPLVDDAEYGSARHPLRGITREQKRGLQEGFGISTMQKRNGGYNVSIGFTGYNSVVTKKYRKGQANSMIARSIEKGTSFRAPHPFLTKTANRTRNACAEEMVRQFEKSFNNLFNK